MSAPQHPDERPGTIAENRNYLYYEIALQLWRIGNAVEEQR